MTGRYLHRFSIIGIPFIRRPVSEPPSGDTMCFVDNGHPFGWSDRQGAIFKDGEWTNNKGKALRFVPQYWTTIDGEGFNGGR